MSSLPDLIPEEDFYWTHEGFMVFTERYLLKRGYCCHQGCRHCPYSKTQHNETTYPLVPTVSVETEK